MELCMPSMLFLLFGTITTIIRFFVIEQNFVVSFLQFVLVMFIAWCVDLLCQHVSYLFSLFVVMLYIFMTFINDFNNIYVMQLP
jgi:hypothetical protein